MMSMASRTTDDIQEICSLCNETITIYAVGECDHPICFKCSARMRVLCDQIYCAICRSDMHMVTFTRKLHKFDSVHTRSGPVYRKCGIYFENRSLQSSFYQLLELQCKFCEKQRPFPNFNALKNHMRKDHNLFYCDLCVDNLKIFPYEHTCYDRKKLAEHRRVGDEDGGHRGHPLCEFCDVRYLDNDELARHLRKDHYYCHFCDTDGISNKFYGDYGFLRDHFQDQHFLCEEGECSSLQFTNAFRSSIDMQAHRASFHARGLTKSAARQARTIDININRPRPARRGPYSRREQQDVLPDEETHSGPPENRRGRKDRAERMKERQEDESARAVSAALTHIQSQGHVNVVHPALIKSAIRDAPKVQSGKYDGKLADFPTLDGQFIKGECSSDDCDDKVQDNFQPASLASKVATVNRLSVQNGGLEESDFPSLFGEKTRVNLQKRPSRTAWEYDASSSSDFPTLDSKEPDHTNSYQDSTRKTGSKTKSSSLTGQLISKDNRVPQSSKNESSSTKNQNRNSTKQSYLKVSASNVEDYPSLDSKDPDRNPLQDSARGTGSKTKSGSSTVQPICKDNRALPSRKNESSSTKNQNRNSAKQSYGNFSATNVEDYPSLSSIGNTLVKTENMTFQSTHVAKKNNNKIQQPTNANFSSNTFKEIGLRASKSSPDFSTDYTSNEKEHTSKIKLLKEHPDKATHEEKQSLPKTKLKKSDFPALGHAKSEQPNRVKWGPPPKSIAADSPTEPSQPKPANLMKMKVAKHNKIVKPDILMCSENNESSDQGCSVQTNDVKKNSAKSKKQNKEDKKSASIVASLPSKKSQTSKSLNAKKKFNSDDLGDKQTKYSSKQLKENIIPLEPSKIPANSCNLHTELDEVSKDTTLSFSEDVNFSNSALPETSLELTDDFPSLTVDPNIISQYRAPPPGFMDKKTVPPPGFSASLINTNVSKCEPEKVVSDSKVFIEPDNFQDRNKKLIQQIHQLLNKDDGNFVKFKTWSGEYRKKKIPAIDYYSKCKNLLGQTNFQQIFPELLVLLPDIEMQKELLAAHKSRNTKKGWMETDLFSCCMTCGQVLCSADATRHREQHGLDTEYPTLGAPTKKGIVGIGTWKIS